MWLDKDVSSDIRKRRETLSGDLHRPSAQYAVYAGTVYWVLGLLPSTSWQAGHWYTSHAVLVEWLLYPMAYLLAYLLEPSASKYKLPNPILETPAA